ncbi:MAG: cytochrome b/b6 domain-containing protein [Wenzhouxiangellaceae bacterium]|nr:cytochrome b/b6 domain-containing protein [Wenzhouxiangellaceae bacterium]
MHVAFYVLMVGLPLMGLAVWLLDPHLGGPALLGPGLWPGRLADWAHSVHYLAAWLLVMLLGLHVAAALMPDGTRRRPLSRMLPGGGEGRQ